MDVPTTFIWGVYDTVSPPRVVSYVWNEYMMRKPGQNSLYFVPDANHYLQNDQPEALVETILHALRGAGRHTPWRHLAAAGFAAARRPLPRRAPPRRRPAEAADLSRRRVT